MKNIQTQIDTLLIEPLQFTSSTQAAPFPKLLTSVTIPKHKWQSSTLFPAVSINLPIIFLIISHPEQGLVTSFNSNKLLKPIVMLTCQIAIFISSRGNQGDQSIAIDHSNLLEVLVGKSSGQFILVRFVQLAHHLPTRRLEIILGNDPSGNKNLLLSWMLSNVTFYVLWKIYATLSVLSLYLATVKLCLGGTEAVEEFLTFEHVLVLSHLSSIVSYDKSSASEEVKSLHASFVDFYLIDDDLLFSTLMLQPLAMVLSPVFLIRQSA